MKLKEEGTGKVQGVGISATIWRRNSRYRWTEVMGSSGAGWAHSPEDIQTESSLDHGVRAVGLDDLSWEWGP